MARPLEKLKAISLRKAGMSFSQIKKEIGVGKSTLSNWLADMPLSPEKINELRGKSPKRIEKYRNTMARKKKDRLVAVYNKVSKELSVLSKREVILCGIFLYWGEGEKASQAMTSLSNTDPLMLRFYLEWLKALGVPKQNIKAVLHLYSDMDINEEILFWSKNLDLPVECFRKPYIKKSKVSGLSYKNGFGHGTCMIRYGSQDLKDYIDMSLKYFRDMYSK